MSSSDSDDDLDSIGPSWQPDPEREGYERWFDGEAFTRHVHRSPDPFSAVTPAIARSLWPGANRDARLARLGIPLTILGFLAQVFASSGLVRVPGLDETALVLLPLTIAAAVAALTALFALRALRRAPRLGGKGIATLALGVSIVLGLAPVLLLVAIGLAGGI